MPRPMKWRKVCSMPENTSFGPMDSDQREDVVIMTVDEYETIRLIDLVGFTQEECAKHMNVARTTVQGIYTSARHKLAQSLVNGVILRIEGGEYRLCDKDEVQCGPGCYKRRHRQGGTVNINK